MRRQIILSAVLFSLVGCSNMSKNLSETAEKANLTAEKAHQAAAIVAERVQKVDNQIQAVEDKIEIVKESFNEKLSDLKGELVAQRERVEAITGKFDANDDGKVTLEEAKKIIAENKDQWFSTEFWASLVLALFGINVGGKLVNKGKTSLVRRANDDKNVGGGGS